MTHLVQRIICNQAVKEYEFAGLSKIVVFKICFFMLPEFIHCPKQELEAMMFPLCTQRSDNDAVSVFKFGC
jgi:hypothetical protein